MKHIWICAVFLWLAAWTGLLICGCASKPLIVPPPETAVQMPPELWRQKDRWAMLKRNMTESEVRSILGEPDRIDVGRWLIYWYYGPTREGPQALFNADSRKLDYWTPPAK